VIAGASSAEPPAGGLLAEQTRAVGPPECVECAGVNPADVCDLQLGPRESEALAHLIRTRKSEHRIVLRGQIVWHRLVERRGVSATARQLGVSRKTVRLWESRYRERRTLEALEDLKRTGRPARFGPREQAVILSIACRRPEEMGRLEGRMTQPLVVEEAAQQGVAMSRSSVQRILASAEVRPHRERYYLFTKKERPDYAARRDAICDAYQRDLPDDEILVCLDEKTGIQARGLPAGLPQGGRLGPCPGLPGRVDQHYVRHGSRSLVVAVQPSTGALLRGEAYPSRGFKTEQAIEFLRGLALILAAVRVIHIIWDNGSTHVSKQMKQFLASAEGQRFRVLYTPAHASWLNLAENFFSRFSRRYLIGRRYRSVEHLDDHLHAAMRDYPRIARPMRWTYNPAERKAA
jgi:transposase